MRIRNLNSQTDIRCLILQHIATTCLFLTFLSPLASAYENEAVTILSSRFSHDFSNNSFTNLTLNSRFIDAFTETERMIAEISVGRNIGRSQISGAYNIHFYRRYAEGEEHRLWQQYRYRLPLENANLDFRIRLEERYFTASDKLGSRTRMVMSWRKALSGNNSFNLGDELVLNLNDYGASAKQGFSQNRLLAGFSHLFPGGTQMDINYQYRYIHQTVTPNFVQHQLQMMLTFDL